MINWVLHVQNAILDGITQIHIRNISCMKENSDRFFVPNKSHEVNDEIVSNESTWSTCSNNTEKILKCARAYFLP